MSGPDSAGSSGPDAAIIATAGHVDHGKSALIRRLTGTDPDTLPAERRRGLTIELGHQRLALPGRGTVSLIDAPGHEDFLGTTIAGLHASTAVLLVVAADEGWSAQTTQHLAAICALRRNRVVLAVTKCDRAASGAVLANSLERLTAVGLTPQAQACVSVKADAGIPDLVSALSALTCLPQPPDEGSVSARVWVDRSFTLSGIGTVVTGTLHEGSLAVGERLVCGEHAARIRGLQRHSEDIHRVVGPVRVAINLAGISTTEVARGALLTGEGAPVFDRVSGPISEVAGLGRSQRWPRELLVGLGTTTVSARLHVRDGVGTVVLPASYAVRVGDALVLRDPGGRVVLGGIEVDQIGTRARARSKQRKRSAEPVALSMGERDFLAQLGQRPWAPPRPEELAQWTVGAARLRELGAQGSILYLGQGLALHPSVADQAIRALDDLDQPFTSGQAREHWGVSRRVALALLGHLNRAHRIGGDGARGWYTVAQQGRGRDSR